MLLFEINSFLCEADILNTKQAIRPYYHYTSVDAWIEQLQKDIDTVDDSPAHNMPDGIASGALKKMRQLALTDPAAHIEPDGRSDNHLSDHWPDWARASHEKGTLRIFDHRAVDDMAWDAIETLAVAEHDYNDASLFKKFMHAKSFQELEAACHAWRQQLNDATDKTHPDGELFIAEFGEYKLVQLMTKAACVREGEVMQNCIRKDYDPAKMGDNHKIYIIKKKSSTDTPHGEVRSSGAVVSFDVINGKLNMLTGKQNKDPDPKYHEVTRAALKHLGVDPNNQSTNGWEANIGWEPAD